MNYEIYAEMPNGREMREIEVQRKSGKDHVYAVQPKEDNYWLICRTPNAALQAFRAPQRFHAASDRLKKQFGIVIC